LASGHITCCQILIFQELLNVYPEVHGMQIIGAHFVSHTNRV